MKLRVRTGIAFSPLNVVLPEWRRGQPQPDMPKTLTVDLDHPELEPDQVFHAANRIEGAAADAARLEHRWQRELRRALDTEQAPSMSVGDDVTLISDAGTPIVGWRCEPAGWTTLTVKEMTTAL